jgi:hypothetical protein
MKSGILNLLEPSGPVKACNGIALLYYVLFPDDESVLFVLHYAETAQWIIMQYQLDWRSVYHR